VNNHHAERDDYKKKAASGNSITRLIVPDSSACGLTNREIEATSSLTLTQATITLEPLVAWIGLTTPLEIAIVTKKEIVKKISEDINLTQLKTKDIVQRTLDAIIQTLVSEGRIELRNFGVFEVKKRAPRKARNPRTGAKVYVPAKNVVTFKPGKEMEELVRKMNPENLPLLEAGADADLDSNGPVEPVSEPQTSSSAD
jgi:nucleoid DNA-binding protein